MGTITKTKKSPRTPKKRVADARPKHATRKPPKTKSTAADLLKIENFGKGVNGAIVAEIVADRAVPGNPFAGVEHLFGAVSFTPIKGLALKKHIRASILSDHNT